MADKKRKGTLKLIEIKRIIKDLLEVDGNNESVIKKIVCNEKQNEGLF